MKGNRKNGRTVAGRKGSECLWFKEAPNPLSEHYTFFSPTIYIFTTQTSNQTTVKSIPKTQQVCIGPPNNTFSVMVMSVNRAPFFGGNYTRLKHFTNISGKYREIGKFRVIMGNRKCFIAVNKMQIKYYNSYRKVKFRTAALY